MDLLELLTLASILCLATLIWFIARIGLAILWTIALITAACCYTEIGNEKTQNVETRVEKSLEKRQP